MKSDREWYRHSQTGDRGYMIERNGQKLIKFDRPGPEIVRKYHETQWLPDRESRPFAKFHIAKVQYEADAQLCFFMGMYERHRKKWETLTDEERIAWMERGPQRTPSRMALYKAIKEALEPYTDKQ